MRSDVPMNAPDGGAPGPPRSPSRTAEDDRRQLAHLIGRLLARHWLRTRLGPGGPGTVPVPPVPRGEES